MKKLILNIALLVSLFATVACKATAIHPDTVYTRIAYTVVNIVIPIPNVIINNTTLRRTATLFTMTYNQSAQTVVLNWTIKFYSDSAGTCGAYLGAVIPDYSKEVVASNASFVNPSTGAFVIPDSKGNYPMNYMGQYDFFNYIAETQPLKVHSLIRQYGYQILSWDK